ncbi:MAG: hypothetical protein ABIS01_02975 [Ferruginibacter sp.]
MKFIHSCTSTKSQPGINPRMSTFFRPSALVEKDTNKQSYESNLSTFFKPVLEDNNTIQRKNINPSDFENKHEQHTSKSGDINIDGPPDGAKAEEIKPVTPCPASVSIGVLKHFNHSDLNESEKESTRTQLGVYSKMVVGPGSDHSGHCMKEALSTVSNNCPKEVYTRGDKEVNPCSGNKCLDINKYGEIGGVKDDATSFIDMHRTKFSDSLLEGTGKKECEVICEQVYTCDRKGTTKGKFRIIRKYKADTFTPKGKAKIHITTGSVEKITVK